MTDITKHDWKERRDKLISILEDTVTLLEKMSLSFENDYHPKRISDFRYLCYGYILISKNNIIGSLLLSKNRLVHQLHHISRNMMEMVTTLTYINDEKSTLEEKVRRFFDYQCVITNKHLDTLKRFPEIPQEFRNEKDDSIIEDNYKIFLSRYKNGNKKVNVNCWSGHDIPQMIEKISDEKKRNDLFRGYSLISKTNNQYVHPSIEYIKKITDEKYRKDVTDNTNNQMEVFLLESIIISVSQIIEIYLEHFQKNRQTFLDESHELEKRFRNKLLDVNT